MQPSAKWDNTISKEFEIYCDNYHFKSLALALPFVGSALGRIS